MARPSNGVAEEIGSFIYIIKDVRLKHVSSGAGVIKAVVYPRCWILNNMTNMTNIFGLGDVFQMAVVHFVRQQSHTKESLKCRKFRRFLSHPSRDVQ